MVPVLFSQLKLLVSTHNLNEDKGKYSIELQAGGVTFETCTSLITKGDAQNVEVTYILIKTIMVGMSSAYNVALPVI